MKTSIWKILAGRMLSVITSALAFNVNPAITRTMTLARASAAPSMAIRRDFGTLSEGRSVAGACPIAIPSKGSVFVQNEKVAAKLLQKPAAATPTLQATLQATQQPSEVWTDLLVASNPSLSPSAVTTVPIPPTQAKERVEVQQVEDQAARPPDLMDFTLWELGRVAGTGRANVMHLTLWEMGFRFAKV